MAMSDISRSGKIGSIDEKSVSSANELFSRDFLRWEKPNRSERPTGRTDGHRGRRRKPLTEREFVFISIIIMIKRKYLDFDDDFAKNTKRFVKLM